MIRRSKHESSLNSVSIRISDIRTFCTISSEANTGIWFAQLHIGIREDKWTIQNSTGSPSMNMST